ncbi:hypothetical protein [Kitasatospora sp. NPDC001132]
MLTTVRSKISAGAVPALTAGLALLPLAPARAASMPDPAGTASYGCPNGGSYWSDFSGGRGRAHFSCQNFRVRIGVKCTDGNPHWSGGADQPQPSVVWRLHYNKVECPVGYSVIGNPTIYVK